MSTVEIARAWEEVLKEGRGHLIVFQNSAYNDRLTGHKFLACIFSCYVTADFIRADINRVVTLQLPQDLSVLLLMNLLKYRSGPRCPVISREVLEEVYSHRSKSGLYNFAFFVFHKALGRLDLFNGKLMWHTGSYHDANEEAMQHMLRGVRIDAMILNIYSELVCDRVENVGNTILYDYSDKKTIKEGHERRFVFCRTKSGDVSKLLRIPGNIEEKMAKKRFGNHYQRLFEHSDGRYQTLAPKIDRDGIPVSRKLSDDQQKVCYLIFLGLNHSQVENYLKEEKGYAQKHQDAALLECFGCGYDHLKNEKRIKEIIKNHTYLVRDVILSLYPWPDGSP